MERHGHRPAIFLLSGDRAQAEQFERFLLDHRFEALFVNHNETPAAARRAFFTALWNLGVVVICWTVAKIRPRDKGVLAAIAGESLFDLSSQKLEAGTEGLRVAETLRTNGSHPEWEI
jgi:hypothetical protein